MKQKVVIQVSMNGQKSRSKAMKIAVGVSGVESAGLQGENHDQIEVTGDGIDVVALATLLRKKVGFARVESVTKEDEKEEETTEPKNEEATVQPLVWSTTYPHGYGYGVHQIYEVRDHDPSCSIM